MALNNNPQNDSQARMKRGLELLESKSKDIIEKADGSFQVPSQTSSTTLYEVRLICDRWVCTCPDFECREVEACKHIFAVRMFIATNTYLKDEPKPKVFADDAIPCTKCGSIRVIRYGVAGIHNVKQIYYCKDCHTKFREPSTLNKVKFTPELITLTLDLYFSGLSLRKIARSVGDNFDVKIGSTTIFNWIQKYIPLISGYVKTLTPELSSTWHADELFVKLKGNNGKNKNKVNKGMAFLWNVMDRRTRFLLASKLSEDRDSVGAVAAFKEAIQNAQGFAPENVFTDSLKSYNAAMGVFEMAGKPNHIANCGVGKPHATNNRIERLNGTLRERIKVQRGWKSKKSKIAEGQRIGYNFVKPHMALNGQTPAQVAGLEIKGWNELLIAANKQTAFKV